MFNKLIYPIIKTKINNIINNYEDVIDNLNKFSRVCSDALTINDNINYNSSINKMKNNLQLQRNKFKNEVLVEIEREITS